MAKQAKYFAHCLQYQIFLFIPPYSIHISYKVNLSVCKFCHIWKKQQCFDAKSCGVCLLTSAFQHILRVTAWFFSILSFMNTENFNCLCLLWKYNLRFLLSLSMWERKAGHRQHKEWKSPLSCQFPCRFERVSQKKGTNILKPLS